MSFKDQFNWDITLLFMKPTKNYMKKITTSYLRANGNSAPPPYSGLSHSWQNVLKIQPTTGVQRPFPSQVQVGVLESSTWWCLRARTTREWLTPARTAWLTGGNKRRCFSNRSDPMWCDDTRGDVNEITWLTNRLTVYSRMALVEVTHRRRNEKLEYRGNGCADIISQRAITSEPRVSSHNN